MSDTIKERMAKDEFLRKIDKLIAGITGVKSCSAWAPMGGQTYVQTPQKCGHAPKECFPEQLWPPTYSTSADAALNAAAKIAEKGSFHLHFVGGKYSAQIALTISGFRMMGPEADTPALAICYEILKANNIEIPKEAEF